MKRLDKSITLAVERPVKVLQYGEGNFLRGFVDYMIDVANEAGVFHGNVVIVKPIPYGNLDLFREQECQYSVSLRGNENGESKVINRKITSISEAIGAYEEYDKYMEYAKYPSLQFIVSNTTEAGIVYDETDSYYMKPPKTYPGKLTKFLHNRFLNFHGDKEKGLIIIPCELIERNGETLRRCVMDFINLWNLEDEFRVWIEEACTFCSTLVDRIITGFPKDEAKECFEDLGYQDDLLVTGELFGLWVIESERDISKKFPLNQAGLPVIFTNDQRPYRERKVRILNGAHTSMVLASYLAGNDYVLESMKDPLIREFLTKTIYHEIIPTLTLSEEELRSFADSVLERFENPFIKHSLLSISLNSVSKWKARCLPSFRDYIKKYDKLPLHLTFSIAALMSFYRSEEMSDHALIGYRDQDKYHIMDDTSVLEFFKENAGLSDDDFALAYLKNDKFFGEDMTGYPGLIQLLSSYLKEIRENGMREALKSILSPVK
ncbi:tagaturonate reductase [Mobilitalea sibirica]|uniref:Tagaturonate reductase n=1 Tax=Mobilitalea sibirica TaxID=1462919 RepID=A0A8J7H1U7_9FIRM|nr:tagaturonate reductase [Mobilitalea sibirica]MBH1940513.1 tagaturonate reductase [Mobilitalea sibirica]